MDNSSYKRKVKDMSSGKIEMDLEEIMVPCLFFLECSTTVGSKMFAEL